MWRPSGLGHGRMMRLSVIIVLASLVLFSTGVFHHARGANSVSVLYVSPLQPPSTGSSFRVAVGLNLSSTDGISGYDVILRSDFYNDSYVGSVLKPVSIQPGNVFQGRQTLPLANCVNGGLGGGSAVGCDPSHGDGPGAAHSAMTVLGDAVPGGQSVTLFYVNFTVPGTGVSLLDFTNDNVTYSPLTSSGPNTMIVLHLDYNGIFSNQGLAAFFNVASPAARIVGVPISFDASGSFNPDGSMITGYRWNFGDGASASGRIAPHTYNGVGSYRVSLNVTDGRTWRVLVRSVSIISSLGALRIFPVPEPPANLNYLGNVTVKLYNVTGSGLVLIGSLVKPPESAWVLFPRLTPGQYRVDFSGDGVTAFSKTETVTPGWTTWDTVYFPVTVLVPMSPPDYRLFIFLGLVGAGVSLGFFGLLRRRRNLERRPRPGNSSRR